MSEKHNDTLDEYKGLPLVPIREAARRAIEEIDKERKGENLKLKTRFTNLNKISNGGFRFNQVIEIAAPSGDGKSTLLNIFLEDFFDEELNPTLANEIVGIYFNLETDSSDEVVKTMARKATFSYNYLLSSEWDEESQEYNKLSDEQFEWIKRKIKPLENKNIYYVDVAGNIEEVYHTVMHIKKSNPGKKIVMFYDHLLLTKKNGESSDGDIIANWGKIAIYLRKKTNGLLIFLNQLNNNIETTERRSKGDLHSPVKSDIYFNSQFFWAADTVIIAPYRPRRNKIKYYGTHKLLSDNLVVVEFVKTRKGKEGTTFLRDGLDKTTFYQFTREEFEQLKTNKE